MSPDRERGQTPETPIGLRQKLKRNENNITLTYLPYDSISTRYHLSKYGFRRMLIYTYEYGDKQAFWIEVNSDMPLPKGEFNLGTFTGKVLVFDLNNNYLTGNRYLNGQVQAEIFLGTKVEASEKIKILSIPNQNKATNSISQNSVKQINGGSLICYDVYTQGCVPAIDWCSDWRPDGFACQEVTYGSGSGQGVSGGTSSGSGGGTGGGGGGSGGGSTGTGNHEPGSGGTIGMNEIGYTFPDNLFNGKDGNKPLGDYNDICSGVQAMWKASASTQNETFGLITSDNKFMYVSMQSYSGGSIGGMAIYQGQAYYTYPDTQGFPNINYAGIIHSVHQYWIHVKGTVHTHSPCLQDGTDGVSDMILSAADQQLARRFTMIPHYIIGCDAVGSFSNSSNSPILLQSGNLNSTCSLIK